MHERAKTTTLIEIRDFLAAEGSAPSPWSAPERAVDTLYRLLRERRDDDRFWRDLAELTRRLEDRRFDPAPLAEVLGDATVERLIGDLRSSLEGPAPKPSVLAWVGSAAGASALAAFLLLGAASGCDNDPGDGDADVDADVEEPCDDAVDLGLAGEPAGVYCDLIEIVEGADITAALRTQLLECLPDLDAAFRAELLEQFATMDAADLASYLVGMTADSEPCWDETSAH